MGKEAHQAQQSVGAAKTTDEPNREPQLDPDTGNSGNTGGTEGRDAFLRTGCKPASGNGVIGSGRPRSYLVEAHCQGQQTTQTNGDAGMTVIKASWSSAGSSKNRNGAWLGGVAMAAVGEAAKRQQQEAVGCRKWGRYIQR